MTNPVMSVMKNTPKVWFGFIFFRPDSVTNQKNLSIYRRKSCADELTCDRPGAPMTTLRKLQLTMMMIYDERCDAVTYGNM